MGPPGPPTKRAEPRTAHEADVQPPARRGWVAGRQVAGRWHARRFHVPIPRGEKPSVSATAGGGAGGAEAALPPAAALPPPGAAAAGGPCSTMSARPACTAMQFWSFMYISSM